MANSLADYNQKAEDEAFRLVGEFMSSWSFVEYELNRGIQKLAGLGILEGRIVLTNMGVRDKIHTLKTLLYMYSPTAERDVAVSLLNTAASMSESRNMIAHTMFWPHEGGGVEFAVTKAKGKLLFPNTVWGKEMFEEKFEAMSKLKRNISSAVQKADRIRSLSKTTDKNWFWANIYDLTQSPPTEGLGGLMTQGLRALQLQGSPSSPTPNPEAAPQTPEAPPPKPRSRKVKSEKK